MSKIKNKAAIVGIASTKYSYDAGMTEWRAACEIVQAAMADAGLDLDDLDGVCRVSSDAVDQLYLQKGIGIDNMIYGCDVRYGTGPMVFATMAIAAGIAKSIVFYRAIHAASGHRFISDFKSAMEVRVDSNKLLTRDYFYPFGLVSTKGHMAILAERYIHEYKVKPEQLGAVAVVARENGAKNPNSVFYGQPITMADYIKSEMAVDPLRRLDCSPVVDGAVAVVVSRADIAKTLRHPPAYIMGVAQGTGTQGWSLADFGRQDIAELPEMRFVAHELFEQTGLARKDISVAQIEDTYSPMVPMELEALGFCKRGEGSEFCEGGKRISVHGQLPLNTSGGALGEGRMHGMNQLVEAVRQIRGTSTAQVKNVEHVLVASGAGGPSDGLILRR